MTLLEFMSRIYLVTRHFVCACFLLSLLQEFGSSYDCNASDNPLSVVRDTAPFDDGSAPKISYRYLWSRLRTNILCLFASA